MSKNKRRETNQLFDYSNRVKASFILMAFFIYSAQPVKLAQAEEIKAPSTINNKVEKVKNFDQYDNKIEQIVKQQSDVLIKNDNANEPENTFQNTILEQNDPIILLPGKIKNFLNKENVSRAISKTNNIIDEATQGAYAGKPYSDTSNVLFNKFDYLNLKKQAQSKKDKDLSNAKKEFENNKKNLLTRLETFVKNLKDKFKTKLRNYQNTKKELSDKLKTVKESIAKLANKASQKTSLQNRLRQALANFNYFQNKGNKERKAYDEEKRKEKHDKKKYKKYKKKYKKKHKKKYKKRYKKYKKKYKKHKKRALAHKNSYQSYEKQKKAQALLYKQLKEELAGLGSEESQLNSLKEEEKVLKENLDSLVIPDYDTTPEIEAKIKYQDDLKLLEGNYQTKINQVETSYQTSLKRTQSHEDNANQPVKNFSFTKSEKTEFLNQIYQAIIESKNEAENRIRTRYQKTIQIAKDIKDKLPQNAETLVLVLNSKVTEVKKSLSKMKKKVKSLKKAYEENKEYKSKVKKYAKKIKKYQKKLNKTHSKKKKRKYRNKLSSAKKKYQKYLKKYQKYGALKKAYKYSYHSAKDILKQYKDQFNLLVQEQQKAQGEYQLTLKQSHEFETSLLKQAEEEKNYYQEQLLLADSRLNYDEIVLENNYDLDYYKTLIPATISPQAYASSFNFNFDVGLGALGNIKKNLKKLKKKVKKAYKKAEKKAKKRVEERKKELAQREIQKRAYYASLRKEEERKRKIEAQKQSSYNSNNQNDIKTSWSYDPSRVYFDDKGNGYSSRFASEYNQNKSSNSWLATSKNWLKKINPLYTPTAYAQEVAPVKIKKSWFGKIKDWGGKVFEEFKKRPIKTSLNQSWNIIKWTPPILSVRAVGLGSKMWYDSYKEKDAFDRIHQVVNTTSISSAVTTVGMGVTGVGIIPATISTVVGSVSDLISAGMYGVKGDWKMAGLMAFGAIPVIGDISQVARLAKYGAEEARAIKVGKGAIKLSEQLNKDKEFYNWFSEAGYEKNFGKMTRYKGFERIEDYEFIKKSLKIKASLLKDSRSSIFYNKTTGKFILTSGGTRIAKMTDWIDDIKNFLGFEAKQYKAAQGLSDTIKSSTNKIQAVVGHSMAGGKAKVIGLSNGIKTYTFNTAFAHNRWFKHVTGKSIDFVKTGDALSYLQTESLLKKLFPKQLGKTIKYDDKLWDILPKHSLRAKVLRIIYGIRRHSIN